MASAIEPQSGERLFTESFATPWLGSLRIFIPTAHAVGMIYRPSGPQILACLSRPFPRQEASISDRSSRRLIFLREMDKTR